VLHSPPFSIPTVVLSSTELGDSKTFICLASGVQSTPASSNNSSNKQVVRLSFPRLPVSFIGTGDLFAALFLAWFTKTDGDLKQTCEKVVSTLQHVIKRTFEYAQSQKDGLNNPANYELRLIQSKADIEQPKISVVGEMIM
jgi:pyridoxine kinase